MNMNFHHPHCYSHILLLVALALFGLQILTSHVEVVEASHSKVELLPGFQGPLPFELETGYVGLGENEDDIEVFYYFIKSENNPKKDPLIVWLSGGPGCSSFTGLILQIGPIGFERKEYDGNLPNLVLRPDSWTKVSSIIFVDLPIGTGFSYAKNVTPQRSDWKLVHHMHQFLRKWLLDHPQFISNQFYVSGDSYSGIPIPAIVQEISNANEKGVEPLINLQGYVLGNPATTLKEENEQIPFAHGMGLISDELYASLQKNCKGEFKDIDSRNELCLKDIQSFDQCLSGINKYNILVIYCPWDLGRRSLTQDHKLMESHTSHLTVPPLNCDTHSMFLATEWANDERVRKALHIREGTIGKWKRCYRGDFEQEIFGSFEFHVNLSAKGYRSLIYSGDHDLTIPFLSTQAWIRALNYSIVDDWRPWFVDSQVAGYTRSYSNQMTFATVKGSGHDASRYNPKECFAMFTRWISNSPV